MALLPNKYHFPHLRFHFLTYPPFNILLFYFIICFAPLIEGGTTYYPVSTIQFLLLIILARRIYSFYDGSPYLSLRSPLFFPILLFLGYTLFIAFLTPYHLPAFQQAGLLFFYVVLFYFSILFNLTEDRFQETIFNLLIGMGVFESVYGIGQYIIFHHRAKGTFFNPDFFGEYLAILFCVSLGCFLDRYKNKKYRWLYGGVLFILGIGIVLSQSRGVAIAAVIGVSIVLWRRFKIKVVYAWIILFLLLVVIPNPLQHRILHDYKEDPYSLSRIEMWKEALHILKDHPLGIGLEMYPLYSPQYAFPIKRPIQQYGRVAESPHNEYLRLFSEMGLIGGVLLLFSIGFFYLKSTDKRNQSFTHYGIVSATLIFFVHAMVDSNFHEPALVITMIILSALLLDRELLNISSKPVVLTPSPSRFILRSIFITITVLTAFWIIKPSVGWYYYSKGYHEIKNQRDEAAELNYKKAISWEGRNARYHNALANTYFNTFQNKHDYHYVFKALEELNQALDLNQKNGIYFKLKGEIYQALAMREKGPEQIKELLDDSFTNYQEAIKLFPYDASLYVAIGSVDEALGNPEKAEIDYNQAILIEPNYMLAREKKIALLLKTGKKADALKHYQALIQIYERVQKMATSDADKSFIYFNRERLEKVAGWPSAFKP